MGLFDLCFASPRCMLRTKHFIPLDLIIVTVSCQEKNYETVSTVITGYTTSTEPYRTSIYGEFFLLDNLKIGPGVKNVCYLTHPKGYFSGIPRPGVTITTHLHVVPKFNEVKKVSFTVGCSSSHLTLHKLWSSWRKKVFWDITLCRLVNRCGSF